MSDIYGLIPSSSAGGYMAFGFTYNPADGVEVITQKLNSLISAAPSEFQVDDGAIDDNGVWTSGNDSPNGLFTANPGDFCYSSNAYNLYNSGPDSVPNGYYLFQLVTTPPAE